MAERLGARLHARRRRATPLTPCGETTRKNKMERIQLVLVGGGVGDGGRYGGSGNGGGAERTHGDESTSIPAIACTSARRASVCGGGVLPLGKKQKDDSCRTGGSQLIH